MAAAEPLTRGPRESEGLVRYRIDPRPAASPDAVRIYAELSETTVLYTDASCLVGIGRGDADGNACFGKVGIKVA